MAKVNNSNRIKTYLQDNQVKLVQTVASFSTMVGSFAAEAREYILSWFPKDYFRYINIDTANTQTLSNVNKLFNKKVNKIPYPSLMISPEILLDNPSDSMSTNMITSRPDLYLMKDMDMYYYKLIKDPDQKLSMYYTCDWVTMNFNVKIAVKSFVQNANVVAFIKNKALIGLQQKFNTRAISTEVPKTFIKILAYLFDYDLDNYEDLEELKLYLAQTSKTPDIIRKKINFTTGKTCFFLNDLTDLEVVVDDIDAPSSIIREGQTEGEYIITLRLQISGLVANNFILSIDKNKFRKVAEDVQLLDDLEEESEVVDTNMYSITIKNPILMNKKDSTYFTDVTGQEHIGQCVLNETITYDLNKTDLHINLRALMQKPLLNIHSYMISKNINPTSLIYVRFSDDKGILSPKKVDIDYKTLEVDLSNITSDVGISIFVDRSVYEAVYKAKEEDNYYFNNNYLTTLNINIEDESGEIVTRKAIVKAFENEDDYYSTDINKQLRVYTIYGIGYVYLVNENDPNASAMKICMGVDKYGNNIIKCFVLQEEE